MKKITLISFLTIFIALTIAIISFGMPIPQSAVPSIAFHVQLAVAIIMGILYIGDVVLFLLGLKRFTAQFKITYFLICIGFLFLAVAQIQLPIFQALNFWNNPWVLKEGIQIPYIVGGIIIYAGVRKFSKLIALKTPLNSWLIFSFIVVVITLFIFVMRDFLYPYRPGRNITLGIPFVFVLFPPIILTLVTILILKIKQKASSSYTNALAWFFMGMATLSIAQWQIVLFSIIGFDTFWVNQGFFQLVYMFSGLTLLKSGHAFNKINIY
ncbi:MAG TPA: hypothetical protein VNW29_02240 [Candidatus Sulfotelmatobacter sp.]|jgi:hypothetical protein|nr:hypothetical protein [Candidatus Sulfotelmatobacter sp.]